MEKLINSEKKSLLSFVYFALLISSISVLYLSEIPPLTIYFFHTISFITIIIFGIYTYKDLKTYGHGNKMFILVVSSILISILTIHPFIKIIMDFSHGVEIKSCKVIDASEYNNFKNKDAKDLTIIVNYKCDDGVEFEQTYYKTIDFLFSKFSDSNSFIENIRTGDSHEIKFYEKSNSITSVKTGKVNYVNKIGYMDILLFILFIFKINILIKVRQDEDDTIKKISSMHRNPY